MELQFYNVHLLHTIRSKNFAIIVVEGIERLKFRSDLFVPSVLYKLLLSIKIIIKELLNLSSHSSDHEEYGLLGCKVV
jgi:hypothetical protein